MRRERHNLSMLTAFTSSSLNPTNARCLASPSSESQPSSEAGTQLTAFSQISAHASGAWRHSNTLVPIPIWDFYFDISEWHILSARAWTPALRLHLTNPCAKRISITHDVNINICVCDPLFFQNFQFKNKFLLIVGVLWYIKSFEQNRSFFSREAHSSLPSQWVRDWVSAWTVEYTDYIFAEG